MRTGKPFPAIRGTTPEGMNRLQGVLLRLDNRLCPMSLQSRFKKPKTPPPTIVTTDVKYDRWLGVREAAAYTKLGRNKLRELAVQRVIPHTLNGGNDKVIFDRLDLDRYMESKKVGVLAA